MCLLIIIYRRKLIKLQSAIQHAEAEFINVHHLEVANIEIVLDIRAKKKWKFDCKKELDYHFLNPQSKMIKPI